DVLFPSLGDRPGSAAHRRRRCQSAIPALCESRAHAAPPAAAAQGFPMGPRRPGFSGRRCIMSSAAAFASPSHATESTAVRPFTNADADRWDAFVERCPEATFFHRIGWREIIEEEFRHRCHYLVA